MAEQPTQQWEVVGERGVAPSVGSCDTCGQQFDLTDVDQRTALCASCFDAYLVELETPFLENYARFGAKAHRTVAEALLRGLTVADPDDRKVMGMRIVEEYLNAAAELMALYAALRSRMRRPVVSTFLAFEFSAQSVAEFRWLTDDRDADTLMRELGLPTPTDVEAARRDVRKRDYKQMRAAVNSVALGLERLGRVEQGALLQIADGLKQSKTLTHKLDWIPERRMNPDQVALLVLEQKRRVLATYPLAIHEPQLEVFVDAIDKITSAGRDMIWLYLHMRDVGKALR